MTRISSSNPAPFTWFSDAVEVFDSPIQGIGVRASAAIPSGEVVVIKGGHVFDRTTRDQVQAELVPAEIQIDDNLFIGPLTPEERPGSMMYLNHSCNPNLGIVGQIAFHAMRPIVADEELTFDYGTGDDDDWEMTCNCGASSCRGVITGRDWRQPALQQRYAGWFSNYLRRKIEALEVLDAES